MNKNILAVLGGTVLALTGADASAQQLTLYGEMDTSLDYISDVGGRAQYRADSGLIDGSYWGLRGTEDLGGGNAAIFRLERGFSVTTGEPFDDHPFYVGLQSERYGTLTLGRQYDTMYDYFAPYTLTGGAGGTAFAHPFDNDNANNSWLVSNAVKVASATYGGLSAGAMYAFSNAAGRFAQNRAYGFGAHYDGGAFNAGVAWMHIDGRGASSVGAYDTSVLPGAGLVPAEVAVQREDTIGAGMSYALGDVTLGAAWSRSVHTGVSSADGGAPLPSVAFSNYEVNALWQVTPAFTLAGMYAYTNAAATSAAHWHQGALQAGYQLSKRTDVYTEAIYQRASSGAFAMINSCDPSGGRNQLLVSAGVRHRF
ncbi:porin [Paraburkholderia lycopersici]|uniref:Outer membrane protein (Porin) n=1 Tax=Paraburkholderia lycopersici TaxID=416944 RepID=A0A1G6HGK3_9BURK|nr:porin [Paraburkholderia lycopersici]SDB93379.1 Outer membrane protein (porin) [Paraburkholderia lycopersici]